VFSYGLEYYNESKGKFVFRRISCRHKYVRCWYRPTIQEQTICADIDINTHRSISTHIYDQWSMVMLVTIPSSCLHSWPLLSSFVTSPVFIRDLSCFLLFYKSNKAIPMVEQDLATFRGTWAFFASIFIFLCSVLWIMAFSSFWSLYFLSFDLRLTHSVILILKMKTDFSHLNSFLVYVQNNPNINTK
jgi:hypothetical protein